MPCARIPSPGAMIKCRHIMQAQSLLPPSYCCLPLPLPSAKAATAKRILPVLPPPCRPCCKRLRFWCRLYVSEGRRWWGATGDGGTGLQRRRWSCDLCRQRRGAGTCAIPVRWRLRRLLQMTTWLKMFFVAWAYIVCGFPRRS